MNRLTSKIAEIQAKVDELDDAGRERLDSNMDVTFEEHFRYQEEQARAHASGLLTLDEAQIVYRALGEVGSDSNGGWASGTDLATKVVVTLVIGELLKRRIHA